MLTTEQIENEMVTLQADADKVTNKKKFWLDKAREYSQYVNSCALQDQVEEAEALSPIIHFCDEQFNAQFK